MKIIKTIALIILFTIPFLVAALASKMMPHSESPAINELMNIGMDKILFVVTFACIFHITLLTSILQILDTFSYQGEISMSVINTVASIFTIIFIGYQLLSILNIEQFSMIATFIGLPFVTIIPNMISDLVTLFRDKIIFRKEDT